MLDVAGRGAEKPTGRLAGRQRHPGVKTAVHVLRGCPVYKDIDPIIIMKGRYINQRDLDERRKVAVIGNGASVAV